MLISSFVDNLQNQIPKFIPCEIIFKKNYALSQQHCCVLIRYIAHEQTSVIFFPLSIIMD